jgi:hypothetical protein
MISNRIKKTAILLLLFFVQDIIVPNVALALTGGPSQPEVESFEPSDSSDMVDLFTGDFKYNIPLFEVDGYPINLIYNAGITMDQEASWVGLGWNINPGAITRTVRGLPDDFKGDAITRTMSIEPNKTWGLTYKAGLEIFGWKMDNFIDTMTFDMSASLGIISNNYKGLGFEMGIEPGLQAGDKNKSMMNMNLGTNLSVNSHQGASFSPSLSFSSHVAHLDKFTDMGAGLVMGTSFNSRSGLRNLTLRTSINMTNKYQQENKKKNKQIDRQFRYGLSPSSSISFANPSYYPIIDMPMSNSLIVLNTTIGYAASGTHFHGGRTGYYSEQSLASNSQTSYGYGYMYSEYGLPNSNVAMHDFNREKDIPFSMEVPFLPIPNYTYDLYSIAGEGINGMFRSYRSDVGYVYDRTNHNISTEANLGIEAGVGATGDFHTGANLDVPKSITTTGIWSNYNQILNKVRFRYANEHKSDTSLYVAYEPAYFKIVGERSVIDTSFYNYLGGEEPVQFSIGYTNNKFRLDDKYVKIGRNGKYSVSSNNYRTIRECRNQLVSYLTVDEIIKAGMPDKITDYAQPEYYNGKIYYLSGEERKNTIRKSHHIGEFQIMKNDGYRYIYGLPAYNNKEYEVCFNVAENSYDEKRGLVHYISGSDNSINNNKGIDKYFTKTEKPGYAHSYMLTSILSPDYVDVKGDGISEDDLGTSIEFKYGKYHGSYKWRIPFQKDSANFNQGFRLYKDDDKGNYLYGEKEVWYIRYIETKNYILKFYLTPREDSYGVADENGGLDESMYLYKVNSIALYSKQDFLDNPYNLEPIKAVHFEYDYSLCPDVPNNSGDSVDVYGAKYGDTTYSVSVTGETDSFYYTGSNINTQKGKLTLKKVYFTYGKTNKAKLNSYQFHYNNMNPKYNLKGYDRWGYYKPNTNAYPNCYYPYTNQDSTKTNDYVAAWSMSQIDLPSGGKISIHYESDDYGYVQDKRAMQMFQIIGVGDSPTSWSTKGTLYSGGNYSVNDYLYFKLKCSIPNYSLLSSNEILKYLKRHYFSDMSQLYFRCFIKLLPQVSDYEFVPGYADIKSYGAINDSIAYIQVEKVGLKDKENGNEVHPIAKAAWQFTRLNLPQMIYGDYPSSNDEAGITSLMGFWSNVRVMMQGFNRMLRSDGYGQDLVVNKSMIRLYSPYMKKLGGGSRVKKVLFSDEWQNMGGDHSSFSYGQEYDYTREIKMNDGNVYTVSSGVASYEPLIGGEENVLKQPILFNEHNKLAPDNSKYIETPLGESYYPSPLVGYSQVKVSNLSHQGVNRTATGYSVHEFYTAKDFPTKSYFTNLKARRRRSDLLLSLITKKNNDYMAASQGYTIVLNDMHGKAKSTKVFQEDGTAAISGVEYYYALDENDSTSLASEVYVVNRDGTVEKADIAKDKDVVVDLRYVETNTNTFKLGINMDGIMALLPIPVPSVYISSSEENTGFKSAVINKVINKYGILTKTVNFDLGSEISTENLAYDAETGMPVLTKVNNEFRDSIFAFTYPASWAYKGMDMGYRNQGLKFQKVRFTDGKISPTNLEQFFMPGDELIITKVRVYAKDYELSKKVKRHHIADKQYWAMKDPNGGLVFINREGKLIDLNGKKFGFDYYYQTDVKIIRSGSRNQQGLNAGQVTTLYNPIKSGTLSLDSMVLQANALEYSENWQAYEYNPVNVLCDSLSSFAYDLKDMLNYMASVDSFYLGIETFDTFFNDYIDTDNGTYDSSFSILEYSVNLNDDAGEYTIWLSSEDELNYNDADSFFNMRIIYEDKYNPNAYRCYIDVLINGTVYTIGLYTDIDVLNYCYQNCDQMDYDSVVNPYVIGVRGNWKPKKHHAYRTKRYQTDTTNIRKDGYYQSFSEFWKYDTSYKYYFPANTDNNWIWTREITKYDPHGFELENKDPLGRYSSEIAGYNYTLPVAVASNAKYNDIAFDGFEDYKLLKDSSLCSHLGHWNFAQSLSSNAITTEEHHSGWYSMKISGNDSHFVSRTIIDTSDFTYTHTDTVFHLRPCEILYKFSPSQQKYVFSGWIKEDISSGQVFSYDSTIVKVIIKDSNSSTLVEERIPVNGFIIDGWQRLYGTFTIPENSASITVMLVPNNSTSTYFDDLRIHPFDANMKTYVYDPVSFRLMAELDENNYATFYEYDEEGQLIRVKKETEKGIYTLQETRRNLKKD